MSVRYPTAPCGCTVELYTSPDIPDVVRMDCETGKRLVRELMLTAAKGAPLPAVLVDTYNAHAETAIEAVTRPTATTTKEA